MSGVWAGARHFAAGFVAGLAYLTWDVYGPPPPGIAFVLVVFFAATLGPDAWRWVQARWTEAGE